MNLLNFVLFANDNNNKIRIKIEKNCNYLNYISDQRWPLGFSSVKKKNYYYKINSKSYFFCDNISCSKNINK